MSTRPRLLVVAAVVSAVAALTACGGSSGQRPSMDAAAQAQLRQDVHAVATAIAAHRLTSAQSALASLNTDLAAAHLAGKLNDATFTKIRAAATTLSADLARLTTSPAPTVTVTTSAPSGGPGDKGDGKGKHGKGKGEEGDGGD